MHFPYPLRKIVRAPDVLAGMPYPKITPLGNHVLIRRDAPAAQIGRIIIPDTAQKTADRGTVVAVGHGRRADTGAIIPCECAPGDVVLFPPQLGVEVTVDGLKYTLLTDDAVIGIIERGLPGEAPSFAPGADPDQGTP